MMNITQRFQPYSLGVQYGSKKAAKELYVAFASKEADCGIVFFDKKTGEEVSRYPFSTENKVGNIYYQTISENETKQLAYLFYEGGKFVADKRAQGFVESDVFGTQKGVEDYKAVVVSQDYDWKEDRLPKISYEDCVVYCMHVRGFTKHSSSGVKAKGTFAGIVEKIPYLKELGITTLELQPAYEFNELPKQENSTFKSQKVRLNYWGYQEAFYYTPKRGYAKGRNAGREFKDMVKALHGEGMEVVMQFYFPDSVFHAEILEILHFWHHTYHVDGFHLKGRNIPIKEVAEDAFLADCKLWYDNIPLDELYTNGKKPLYSRLAIYNDGYMQNMRHLLKGDEGCLFDAMWHMQENPACGGRINYLSNYYGFTMMDMVSYENKHNELNDEENLDGSDYNSSWNCGVEGATDSKEVLALRERQIRNAFMFLILSQGTPLFFMGDEFGNSQNGNNNPYCQDNEISWLNWKDLNKNKWLFEYVKYLLLFRKSCGVFPLPEECVRKDYKSCGFPDLSYHGSEAWKQLWDKDDRHVSFMLCGEYAKNSEDCFYYVAINMHWNKQVFGLPKLPQGFNWSCIFSTESKVQHIEIQGNIFEVPARSIVVLVGSK